MSTKFITNPFKVLKPDIRWAPGQDDLFQTAYDKLLPPLVHKIRKSVKDWRDKNYKDASETSKALLNFWFTIEHWKEKEPKRDRLQYYFAQREAIESIIYLYEVAKARDKYELLKFDSSGRVRTGMFDESWTRYVVKMATGSGKTKVASLVVVWSYFHKLYEEDSTLSKNFLLIAPNIIVLNRLKKDFEGQKIFKKDPLIPEDGFEDRNWRSDFQLTVHLQDELKAISPAGNLFLTNVHRIFLSMDKNPSFEDTNTLSYFVGEKPMPYADKSAKLDLGEILRSAKLKDLVVLNDEAHHIHDEKLAWFRNIADINNKLKLRYKNGLSLQVDFTATPKHDNGAIFVQTICDYPLVEAIRQNIVKSPVLPDEASRGKLQEKPSDEFVEQYEDYIHLGYIEWKKQYEELKKANKTPLLFIMTTETGESNDVAEYLKNRYPEFKKAVLVIHTNKSGEINEKRPKTELENLRKAADNVDKDDSPYKAIVSVLMLREGWDVKNVTTIVGLRPYSSKSNILPEQTLGRGIRKMFGSSVKEELAVIGTSAFIDFVESIKQEGVELGYRKMGENTGSNTPIVIEVDKENRHKDLGKLDISIPVLTPRIYREYKKLENIDISRLEFKPISIRQFSEEEKKEIIFEDLDRIFSHKIIFDRTNLNYRSVIAFFTNSILKESRLVSGFEVLYPKVRDFIKYHLFGKEVNVEGLNVLRNLSELEAKKTIFNIFKKAIDNLTITDKGSVEIKNYIKLREVKPMVFNNQEYITPKKSIFNRIIGNSFELEFANFLDNCPDIISFAKNGYNIKFKMEYQGEDGNIHDYYPDFIVKQDERDIYIVETKGREDFDDRRKIERLKVWCVDVNSNQNKFVYHPVYVKQEEWEKYRKDIKAFKDVIKVF
ncbi:MAG: DEAD/DEAH box helicase family protein, partial [Candidatus Cloacimonetes bacterium]|nr:DEAD/DEAH box helicase family protein [Candidatus Cloacimonadota bacterium]